VGAAKGMPVREAAQILLDRNPAFRAPARRQIKVHSDELGSVYALDTVKYADSRIAGGVLCMGSHAARAMADYVEEMDYRLAGVITNDAGPSKDRSGIAGLAQLDRIRTPAAAVACASARVGDACSTYFDGRISALNETAAAAGVTIGEPASAAARKMLEYAAREKNNG